MTTPRPLDPPPQALVDRYRTRAPRYTSYPTAPQFKPIAPAAVDAALAAGDGPLSLYVHVPFCKSLCLYCGCHVEIRGKRQIGADYVDGLLAELALLARRMRPGRTLAQLALGGGTPTFLLPTDMARLLDGIRATFPFRPDGDYAIEIDPRTVDVDYLHTLVDLGFNRYSFGVQDFDEDVLETVKRRQTEFVVRRAVDTLRARGDFQINLDLMYGLPHQDPERFDRSLAIVTDLRPSRIALFQYAHVPWMKPAQKVLEKSGIPDSTVKSQLFALTNQRLTEAGYHAIGMDHFALASDELVSSQASGTLQRNFMGYTTGAGLDQVGIGVSSIGYFQGVYAQNLKKREDWRARIDAGELPVERGLVLDDEDLRRRRLIMALFCNFSVRWPADERYDAEIERLRPLEADGLCVVRGPADGHGGGVDVTPLGRHFIRNVCSIFDAYFEADVTARRYSVTA